MNDQMKEYLSVIQTYWKSKSEKQKKIMFASFLLAIIFIIGLSYFFSRTVMVPLYTNLKPSETGTIKENLDARGIKSEIADGGTTIRVPEDNVETLMVELAAEGIPNSGNIDYSFFAKNASFGMTDNEFNVMKLGASRQNWLSS